VAVAELAAAAALLLVPAVRLGGAPDRLLVGHARRLEVDLGAEAIAQAVDDHLDVHLRQAGDDLLAGLVVAVQVDRRVLLLEAAQRDEDLLLVALGVRRHRERHDRCRQLDLRHLDRLVPCGQPVAGLGLLELGDGADVARADVLVEVADALLGVRARVEHLVVAAQHALVDAEEVDAPRERVGLRLEDVGEELLVLVRLEGDVRKLHRAVLHRRGQVLDDRVEQTVRREVARGHAAGHREDVAVVRPVLQGVDDLVVGDGVALQVALHERLGDLAHLVHQLLAVLLGQRPQVVRDRDLPAVVAVVALVLVGAHVDEVDHPADVLLGPDRDLGGDDVPPERRLERVQRAEEVGPLAVEHVHEDQARDVELLGALPQPLGVDLDPHDRVDDEDGRLADAQGPERVGDEAGLAGSVEEVDLAVLPLEGGEGGRDGHLALLLVGLGVGGGRALLDGAEPVDRAGLEQERLVQGRLPAPAVTDQGDIADAICTVVHDLTSSPRMRRPSLVKMRT
jgi:hypothetical protein